MRSLWGKAPFQFDMRDLPTPEPGLGQVLVRVRACGICGTDLHFLRHNQEWTPLGHEAVGEIVAVGPGVVGWKSGEMVIVENHVGCGVCIQCKNGRALYCQNLTSYMDSQAGFSDYLVVRADMVQRYDAQSLTPAQAALAEPLTVALDLLGRADPDLNDEVVVLGPGPIGLMTVRLAKLRGARRVFLIGATRSSVRGRHRLDVGQLMGADLTFAEDEGNLAATVKALVPGGVDRVLITAPPHTLLLAFEIARFGAVIGLIGIEFGGGELVTFDVNAFHFKKLQLRASHAIPNHYFPIALDLLARRVVEPNRLISHTFALDDYRAAFQTLSDAGQPAVKVVLVV